MKETKPHTTPLPNSTPSEELYRFGADGNLLLYSYDRIMDISAISSFVDELRALNCELCFDTLPNADHETTCKSAFTANRLQWLFAH